VRFFCFVVVVAAVVVVGFGGGQALNLTSLDLALRASVLAFTCSSGSLSLALLSSTAAHSVSLSLHVSGGVLRSSSSSYCG